MPSRLLALPSPPSPEILPSPISPENLPFPPSTENLPCQLPPCPEIPLPAQQLPSRIEDTARVEQPSSKVRPALPSLTLRHSCCKQSLSCPGHGMQAHNPPIHLDPRPSCLLCLAQLDV